MKHLFTALSVFVLVLVAARLASAQSDPRIGTWKLNVAKSKFDLAASRAGETRTYELSGGAVMVHVETMTSKDSKETFSYDGTPDGKDHPYTQNGADTLSIQHKGTGFTAEGKKGGKVLFTTTATFSADGKVMTQSTKGMNATGQRINSVRVYEKQ